MFFVFGFKFGVDLSLEFRRQLGVVVDGVRCSGTGLVVVAALSWVILLLIFFGLSSHFPVGCFLLGFIFSRLLIGGNLVAHSLVLSGKRVDLLCESFHAFD